MNFNASYGLHIYEPPEYFPTTIDFAFDPLLKYAGKQQLKEMREDNKANFQAMNMEASYR